MAQLTDIPRIYLREFEEKTSIEKNDKKEQTSSEKKEKSKKVKKEKKSKKTSKKKSKENTDKDSTQQSALFNATQGQDINAQEQTATTLVQSVPAERQPEASSNISYASLSLDCGLLLAIGVCLMIAAKYRKKATGKTIVS